MVDLILFSFYAVTFAGGFWCGQKFGSFAAMAAVAKEKIKSWL